MSVSMTLTSSSLALDALLCALAVSFTLFLLSKRLKGDPNKQQLEFTGGLPDPDPWYDFSLVSPYSSSKNAPDLTFAVVCTGNSDNEKSCICQQDGAMAVSSGTEPCSIQYPGNES